MVLRDVTSSEATGIDAFGRDVVEQAEQEFGSSTISPLDVPPPEQDELKDYQTILQEEQARTLGGQQGARVAVPSARVRYLDPNAYNLQAEEKFLRDEQARIRGAEDPEYLDFAKKEAEDFRQLAEQSKAALDSWKPARTGAYKTFTDRVLSALVVGLGEVGRTLTGGKNVGLEMLNKIIDDEARRQQQEYQRLREKSNADQNAYTRSMNVLRNERIAFENTKNRLMTEAAQIGQTIGRQTGASMNLDKINTEIANRASEGQAKLAMETNAAIAKLEQDSRANDVLTVKMRRKASDDRIKAEKLRTDLSSALGKFTEAFGEPGQLSSQMTISDGLKKSLADWAKSSDPDKFEPGSAFAKSFIASTSLGPLVDFYNKISAIAFGAASEGQSASSISNKDVQIFINLLASPNVSNKQIYDYMKHLENRAIADASRQRAFLDSGSISVGDAVYYRSLDQLQKQQDYYDQFAGTNYLDQFKSTRTQ